MVGATAFEFLAVCNSQRTGEGELRGGKRVRDKGLSGSGGSGGMGGRREGLSPAVRNGGLEAEALLLGNQGFSIGNRA